MFSFKLAASRATLALAARSSTSVSAKFYSSAPAAPRSKLRKLLDGKHIFESIPVSQSAKLLFKNELNLESSADVAERYAKLSPAEKKTFGERAKASKKTRQQFLDDLTRPQLKDLLAYKKAVAEGELKKLQAVDLIKSVPSLVRSAVNVFTSTFKGKGLKIETIVKSWKDLPDPERKPFEDAVRKSREAYPSNLESWKASLSDEAIAILNSGKNFKKLPKSARQLLRPKKTRTPYINFVSEEFRKPFSGGDLSGMKLQQAKMKAAAAKWSAMSADQKKAYAN